MKILIAVPTYENIYPDTFKSIYNLDKGDHDVFFDFVRGYDVANARNNIARETLDNGFDYVLMVDNDEVLSKDALINLLETEEQYHVRDSHCMVVGYCLSRPLGSANKNGRTTAFKFGGKNYVADDAYTGKELKRFCDEGINRIQIRGSGLGCALIHRSILEKMTYPWFKWCLYDDGTQLSEDLYFCEKFCEVPAPIFVDTRVSCGHMMRHIDFI